jgi:hypothetical protein
LEILSRNYKIREKYFDIIIIDVSDSQLFLENTFLYLPEKDQASMAYHIGFVSL